MVTYSICWRVRIHKHVLIDSIVTMRGRFNFYLIYRNSSIFALSLSIILLLLCGVGSSWRWAAKWSSGWLRRILLSGIMMIDIREVGRWCSCTTDPAAASRAASTKTRVYRMLANWGYLLIGDGVEAVLLTISARELEAPEEPTSGSVLMVGTDEETLRR